MSRIKIEDLDDVVIEALNLFVKKKVPRLHISFKRPLVVGSGNAAVTGKILFKDADAIFADESTYLEKIKGKKIDGAVLISASGGKSSPKIARELRKRNITTVLITNNSESEAVKIVNRVYVFPKNIEPYTYNVSTYLGMVLSKTRENPKRIIELIKSFDKKMPHLNLRKFDSFFIILPEKFDELREMILTKFDELFGSKVSGRAFTFEQTKHAKTLVDNKKELFVSFVPNNIYGKKRLNISLPRETDFGTMFAFAYYFIGKIQKAHPNYFKKNIENYLRSASRVFGEKLNLFV